MAKKLDPKEMVNFEELLTSNTYEAGSLDQPLGGERVYNQI